MTAIHKSTIVPYSAEEMYTLVNDIESYPDFLRWCRDAKTFDRTDTRLQATVFIEIGKIKQFFTTDNSMRPGRSIHMRLVEGPFRFLTGHWQFDPQTDSTSYVSLDIEFEFKSKLLKMALNHTFNHIMENLVESFTQRACEVYGKR